MFDRIDLRELAQITAPDRAFLSIYLAGPKSMASIEKRVKHTEAMLRDNKDEALYFAENIEAIRRYLGKNPFESGSMCIFSCWVLDYLVAYPLNVTVQDLLWVDSSPYIRPLAELQDEYANFAVVAADNNMAKICLVTSAKVDSEDKVSGNIKNHVKKGGWSQRRYERRRDKQLLQYAKEIAEKLTELDRNGEFRRILLVGSRETIAEIQSVLPNNLRKKLVGERNLDLGKGDDCINQEVFDLFFIEERDSERILWERIKGEYMRGGLAVAGIEDVLAAARIGNVEEMIVNRHVMIEGVRCRSCEGLSIGVPENCPDCGLPSLFKVDLVNELVEILSLINATADFVDPIPGLSDVGDIAALLRYNQ